MEAHPAQVEAFVDIHKAASHLGLAVSTVYQLVSQGKLPHYKLGRAVRFRLSELDSYATRVDPT